MRKEPYTERGISRVPCCRCGKPSVHQWQCCATGNKWMPLCLDCDIGLNRVALEYIGHPETTRMMRVYSATQKVIHDKSTSKSAKTARGEALTMRRVR